MIVFVAPVTEAEEFVTAPPAVQALSNCYAYVRSKIPSLPPVTELHSNSIPLVGSVVMFMYKDKEGKPLPHYAILTSLNRDTFTVDENNYKRGVTAPREVKYNDPSIIGFWYPPTSH